jgi:threonine/homoserine/homoserine lactone efflux protein
MSYAAFLAFTFILVVTPGSTTAVVVRNTLEGGRWAGYVTALGAAAGNTSIAIACGAGLSVLLAVWPGSLDVVRVAGAVFLAWLGLSSLYRAWSLHDGGIGIHQAIRPAGHQASGLARQLAYFGDGLAINLLSPVLISYYLSVVPSFVPPGASRFYYTGLAATHVGLAMLCHGAWATGLDAMRRWFVAPRRRRLLQTGTGLALLALAINVLA